MPRSFLPPGLPPAANLATARARRGFGLLASGVGVNLGVEDEEVDVLAAGNYVIEAAVADVIGPAVAADDPDALFDEHVGEHEELLRVRRVDVLQLVFQFGNALALVVDIGLRLFGES